MTQKLNAPRNEIANGIFPNTEVQWAEAQSGNWSTAADWQGGVVPGPTDDVTIAATGSNYTVTINTAAEAASLLVDSANATVMDQAALSLAGALTVDAGTFVLASGGDITGGTLSASGSGAFLWQGGTLTNDTYQGNLLLAQDSELLTLDGTTLADQVGTGPGTLSLTGFRDDVAISGPFAPATIDLSGTKDVLALYGVGTLSASTLNIGALASGRLAPKLKIFDASGGKGTLTLAADTTLSDTIGSALITGKNLINAGTISVQASNGTLASSATLMNAGTVEIGAGTLSLEGGLTNTGTILVSGASSVLALGGSLNTKDLGAIVNSGGLVAIGGELRNAGSTLTVGPGTALGEVLLSGEIIGGVVAADSTGGFSDSNASGAAGTLSGVQYQIAGGKLNYAAPGALVLTGGTELSNGNKQVAVRITGRNSNLTLDSTVSGISSLTVSSATGDLILANETDAGVAALNVNHMAGMIELRDDFDNTNGTLAIGNGTSLGQIFLGGTVTGGVLVDGGNGFLTNKSVFGYPGGTLSGVTYEGAALTLNGTNSIADYYMVLENGTQIDNASNTGTGTLIVENGATAIVEQSTLESLTLDVGYGDRPFDAVGFQSGAGATDYLLDNATVNLGYGNSSGAGIQVNNGTLTLGSQCVVNSVDNGQIDLSGGSVVNQGTISVADSNLNINSGYSPPGTFTNQGSMSVSNGNTLTIAVSAFDNEAALGVSGKGSEINVEAYFSSSAAINIGSGSIFDVESGAPQTVNGNISNNGTLSINNYDFKETDLAGGLTGQGQTIIISQSELGVGTASSNQTVTFQSDAWLVLDNAAKFAATINDFGSRDVIILGKLTASTATLTSSSLIVTLTTGSVLDFAMTGVPNGETVSISSDGHTLLAEGNGAFVLSHDPGFADSLRADLTPVWHGGTRAAEGSWSYMPHIEPNEHGFTPIFSHWL